MNLTILHKSATSVEQLPGQDMLWHSTSTGITKITEEYMLSTLLSTITN